MSLFNQQLPFNFPTSKKLNVKFSSIDLSSDAGLLMVKQAEENLKICQGFADCLEEKREGHKVKHSLVQLVSQTVYQIIGGYEDANDSNYLRNDPIFQLICGKTPTIEGESLASQLTISRWENQILSQEIKKLRCFFVDKFIESYPTPPEEIILNIDSTDAVTYGNQQLSLFHGYFKELKRGLQGDRLSCHQFIANQFRLFLSQAAYILMLEIREAASQTRLEKAQISPMRETLIKIAARVKVSTRRIMVELTSNFLSKLAVKFQVFSNYLRQVN